MPPVFWLVQVAANLSSHWMKAAASSSAEWGASSNVKQIMIWFGPCLLYSLLHISPWLSLRYRRGCEVEQTNPDKWLMISVSCRMMIASRCLQLLSFFAPCPAHAHWLTVMVSWSLVSGLQSLEHNLGQKRLAQWLNVNLDNFPWSVRMDPQSVEIPRHSCSPHHGVLVVVFVIISVQEQICWTQEVKVALSLTLCGKIFIVKKILDAGTFINLIIS